MLGFVSAASIPVWGAVLFYGFFIATMVFGLIAIFQKKLNEYLNVLAIIVPVFVFFVFLSHSIGRPLTMNEYDWLFSQFLNLRLWAIFVAMGYGYLLYWWYLYISSLRKK